MEELKIKIPWFIRLIIPFVKDFWGDLPTEHNFSYRYSAGYGEYLGETRFSLIPRKIYKKRYKSRQRAYVQSKWIEFWKNLFDEDKLYVGIVKTHNSN